MVKVNLDEVIAKLESGSRPKGGIVKGTVGVPSLGAEHLNDNGGFNFTNIKFITDDFFSSQNKGILEKGDILIVKDGATTGKVSFIGDDFQFERASINEHLFKLSINRRLALPKYVFWNLFSREGKKKILIDFRGATVGGISRSFTKNIDIPLPPLEDQKRIVKILDTADTLRQKRKQAITLLDDYIKSVFLDMFGDPEKNQKNWDISTLNDLCFNIADIDHNMPKEVENGFPFISAKDLLDNGTISFQNVKNISKEDFLRLSRKIKPQKGDIIYSRIGAKLGKARIVNVDLDFLVSYSCCTIKPNNTKINTVYLNHLLNTPFLLRKALENVRAIGVPDLGMDKIRSFQIITPPLKVQNIFAKIDQKTDALRQSMLAQSAELETQFQSLLQKSFHGELLNGF